ncbi:MULTISPECIES: helix-turn-helix domain-containing protein [Bacillaceae]|uniref:response regulator transcription factor n=1 Tax=Bacillaceae TaxID=186817 RepID=UPI000E751E31|nr:helix-turn-helix domain-containing protein [Bacillus sp. PK3_68]RJS60333.1 DNA-binding response regulator [Bacillus sp. PK3_68]
MNILLVDDEPLELEQLAFLIGERYPLWSVFTAEDAAQARKVLISQSIHLALVDIHMPGESGLDLCAYIRNEHEAECILITAFQEFDYAKQAIRLQVLDYIVKPVISKELYHVLDAFKEKHRYLEGSPPIQEALAIIHQHYQTKLNLSELAERIHVAPTYLSRKFSEELGVSFQEYLVKYRIEKAKKLLKEEPHWSMSKIAEETGFSSQNHFNYTFKKLVHFSPRQYKESLIDD